MIGEGYFQRRAELDNALFSLLLAAGELRAPAEHFLAIQRLQGRLREPFLFVALGDSGSGKRTVLDALFGREFFGGAAAPDGDTACLYKFGEAESEALVADGIVERTRPAAFLRSFQVADSLPFELAQHSWHDFAHRFLIRADLILAFCAPGGGAEGIELRGLDPALHGRCVRVFALAPDAGDAPPQGHPIGNGSAPIFHVSAARTLEEKIEDDPVSDAGFLALEEHIDTRIIGGEARTRMLEEVRVGIREVLDALRARSDEVARSIERGARRIEHLAEARERQKAHSMRQVDGLLWDIAQVFEKSRKRSEVEARAGLAPRAAAGLAFGANKGPSGFQHEIETALRANVKRHTASALDAMVADLGSIARELHTALQADFPGVYPPDSSPVDCSDRWGALQVRLEPVLSGPMNAAGVEGEIARHYARSAAVLRIPAGIACAAALGAVGAGFASVRAAEILGVVCVLALLASLAIVHRRGQGLSEICRRHSADAREAVLAAVEPPLRAEVEESYRALAATLEPASAHLAALRAKDEPVRARLDAAESALGGTPPAAAA